jgi:predicted PurR-regulated permease PerM
MRGAPIVDRPSPTEGSQPADEVGGGRGAQWAGLEPAAARVAWTLLVIGGAMALVYALRHVLLLLAFSVFFAYLIFPLVEATQRFMPGLRSRTRAIVFVYLVLLGVAVATGGALGPRLTAEARALAERLPQIAQQWSTIMNVGPALERLGWQKEAIRTVETALQSHAGEVLAYGQSVVAAVLKWLVGAWVIVLIPIFAFFILKDAEEFVATLIGLFEERHHRQRSLRIGEALHLLLGDYMRALVLLSLITFAVWSIVFLVVGAPYPLMLAAVGATLEVVPVVGPVVAGIIVVSVAVFTGFGNALPLVLFIVAWRFIQDYVSSPLVMARGIEIHPALVIFGVIAGGEIAGPAGMFLSVPVMAGLRILWRHAREAREPSADEDGPPVS